MIKGDKKVAVSPPTCQWSNKCSTWTLRNDTMPITAESDLYLDKIGLSRVFLADVQILASAVLFGIGFIGQRAVSVDGLGPMTCNVNNQSKYLRFNV